MIAIEVITLICEIVMVGFFIFDHCNKRHKQLVGLVRRMVIQIFLQKPR